MLYFGVTRLKMSEEQFWATTPRKFKALADIDIMINSAEQSNEPEYGYIDQIPGW